MFVVFTMYPGFVDTLYKVRNCAYADLSSLLLHVTTWNFVDNFLTLATS